MKGTRQGNLYFLDGSTITGRVAVSTSSSSEDDASDTSKLWHMRLGYVGEKALQGLVKQGLLKGAKTGSLSSASIVYWASKQESSLVLQFTVPKGF
ncbi:hypothetical protein CsSME_00032534 [Camellia sinensis var. sinensis]